MHILFLTENFPPEVNASASRVYERACYWIEWGHQVTVLTSAPNFPEGRVFPGYKNDWYRTEEVSGIRVVRVKTYIAQNKGFLLRTLDFASYMGSAYVAGLLQREADVVIATSPQFFAAVGGWALAASRRLPFVFELGDLWPASIEAVGAMSDGPVLRSLERLELFLYARSAAIVALTPSFKQDLVRRNVDPDKIEVVVNGVDMRRFEPREPDNELARELGLEGCFVVGYIGTHGMAHDLWNALAAAERLRDLPNVKFLFVGAGAERDALMARANERGLDNVVFVPRRAKEEMPSYWSLCSVALIHLKNDPVFAGVIPSKIFEAMAMGRPLLLVAPAGEASHIIEREGAGVVVAPGEPSALEASVRELSSDPAQCDRYAEAALAAAPRYSRERQARDVLSVLTRVGLRTSRRQSNA